MSNYTVIIPIYNHGKTIGKIVERVIELGFTVLVVDDGSADETKVVLKDLDKRFEQYTLLTLPQNCGKGGALSAGFRKAFADGFTHGVTVDADGQHNIEDLPAMIELSRENPLALVAGSPVYDENIPSERLQGRKISNFWTTVTTLSKDVDDVLCGFRCYPLAAADKLLSKRKIGQRMNFEPDVLVRMYWQGTPVVNFKTAVIYPEDGLSHFNYLWDNVRISFNFFILYWGMMARFPFILANKKNMRIKSSKEWHKLPERGNNFGLNATLFFYTILGKKLARVLLQPVVGYFYLTDHRGRKASKNYLSRVSKVTGKKLSSYRHYLNFGYMLLDRFDIHRGKTEQFNVKWHNYDQLEAPAIAGTGGLVVGAHIGSFDLLRTLADTTEDRVVIRPLMLKKQAELVNSFLEKLNPGGTVKVIEMDESGVETTLRIKESFEKSELVALLADRHSAGSRERVLNVPFLGQDAPLPKGPWMLAQMLQAPVTLFFPVAVGYNSYEIFCHKIEVNKVPRGKRDEAINSMMFQFAKKLEEISIKYPYQWFNFFDFWDGNNEK